LSSWEKMTHLNFVVILYKATQRSLAMSRRRTGPCEPESKGHRFDSARGPILLRFLGILKLARHLTNGVEISHWILRLVLLTYKYQVRFCIEGLSINAWEPLYHVLYESNRCDSLWNMLCMIAWNDCLIIILDGFGSLLCYHHTPSSLNHNISLFTPFWRACNQIQDYCNLNLIMGFSYKHTHLKRHWHSQSLWLKWDAQTAQWMQFVELSECNLL
jgi:hypothetical protein